MKYLDEIGLAYFWTKIKAYIDNLSTGVIGVKGNAEDEYRQGNVNLTPANIGLSDVENKSVTAILNEMTANQVKNALGSTAATRASALGLGNLATKDTVTNVTQHVEGTGKNSAAVASNNNVTISCPITQPSNYHVASVVRISRTGGSALVLLGWHLFENHVEVSFRNVSSSTISKNAITVTVSVQCLKLQIS